MGWKLGYVTSLDGARAKGAIGTDIDAFVVEEDGARRDELAELTKRSEYDGGGALLSKGIGKFGGAIA